MKLEFSKCDNVIYGRISRTGDVQVERIFEVFIFELGATPTDSNLD